MTVDIAQGFGQGSGADALVSLEGIIGSAFSGGSGSDTCTLIEYKSTCEP